jgi:hypothetical protein
MNRIDIFSKPIRLNHQTVSRNVAIHEAGHAAAIYRGNKQKGLPPVYFQIIINSVTSEFQSSPGVSSPDPLSNAYIEGGRLIQNLPASIEEATNGFSIAQILAYQHAFEADIINLLVGPLAEAKAIAHLDGELFNHRLVTINALHYYGGTSDIERVNEYLDCFIAPGNHRELKAKALFLVAYNFICERSNWLAIIALAEYILSVDNSVIDYDDIIAVLENGSQ